MKYPLCNRIYRLINFSIFLNKNKILSTSSVTPEIFQITVNYITVNKRENVMIHYNKQSFNDDKVLTYMYMSTGISADRYIFLMNSQAPSIDYPRFFKNLICGLIIFF